jgi:hypothetical protein
MDQDKGKNKHTLRDAVPGGKEIAVIGIDALNHVFQAVRCKGGAESHHTLPQVRNEQALSSFTAKNHVMQANFKKLVIVYVLDGAPNPIKSSTNVGRVLKVEEAKV